MIKNINSKLKKILMMGAFALMTTATVTSCKNNNEPSKRTVSEVTPTDKEEKPTATVTVAPTNEPTATVTVAPTSTPTPTPIVSNITTVTKPSKVEGYTEITSLSAKDIKEGSMIQEYDKVLEVKDYAETMDLTNVTSDDLVALLEDNTALDAETKKEVEDTIKAFDTNKIDVPKAALYTNLPNIKIEEGNYNTNRAVVFDPFNCIIYINTNVVKTEEEKKEAIKLGLGYASLEAYTEVNGEKFLCSPSILCYDANGNIVEQGEFAKNAVAQIIASKAEGKTAITTADPNYADVLKLTVALNCVDPNVPYTYERYASEGYEKLVEGFSKRVDSSYLLMMDSFYNVPCENTGFVSNNKEFTDAFNSTVPLFNKIFSIIANSYGSNENEKKFYLKNVIDAYLKDVQGIKLSGESGYTKLDDGTIVVNEFTMEAFRCVMENYIDIWYSENMTKTK